MQKTLYISFLAAALLGACASQEQKEAVKAGTEPPPAAMDQTTSKPPGAPPVTASPEALFSKNSIMKVQQALADKGFSVEKSGVMDSPTKTALKSFQQQQGIAATGMPDQLTLRKLDLDPQQILPQNPMRPSQPEEQR